MTALASSQPAVSICVPTYNGADYLARCLDSILQQTFSDFEIVAVDDRSDDDTVHILREYWERDRRLRIFENPRNVGLVGNWNQCIEHARGEWIKFVFQDDWIAPECVQRMVDVATESRALLTVCRRQFVFEGVSDDFRREFRSPAQEKSPDAVFQGGGMISAEDACGAFLQHGLANVYGEPTAALIHREAFERYGRFDGRLIQICDLEFWLRIATNCGLSYIPETLAYFRVHSGSTTARNLEGRRFSRSVADPLLVLCEIAYGRHFKNLRAYARSRNRDLVAELSARTISEQRWGPFRGDVSWRDLLARHPRLSMPWSSRLRSWASDLVDRIR